MTRRFLRVCAAVVLSSLFASPLAVAASAQTPQVAKVIVTVVDPTGAVIPGATVTITGTDDATKAATIPPAKTVETGQATVEKLALGRYTIRAEFPGFAPAELKDQRLRTGDNKHVIILPLKRVEDSVIVGRDPQDAATDRSLTFGTVLTREQIQALSDDPDEMRRQLMEMAGPDAILKVDSFEGQQLPPKAQIKSIRMSRDQFAAENHMAFSHIDIITQPGVGPLRTSLRANYNDAKLDGENPLVQARGPGQQRQFGGTVGGTLIKDKADFSVSLNGFNNWSTPQLYAATSAGTVAGNMNIRMPAINQSVNGLLNYALTKDQTIRLGVNVGSGERENLGIGQYDLIERAYAMETKNWGVRFQESGPLGRRMVTNTRIFVNGAESTSRSTFEGPTYVVQDAFTAGGAQRSGGSRNRSFSAQQDFDYVRGLHSLRTGIMVDGGYVKQNTSTNYLGTYTFESLNAWDQGRPRSYTRRIGDATMEYWNIQSAIYLQDDIRPRKNISVSLGLRYETQMRVKDRMNFAPRAGFTWSPLKSGRMSVRGSWGIFYDWFPMGVYSQTLLTDGTRQREVNIPNPSFPDPGPVFPGAAPTNRYLLPETMRLPLNNRFSGGVSGSIKRLNLGVTYAYTRTSRLLVGENLNTPENGVRPFPEFANLVRTVHDAASRSHTINGNLNVNLSPTGPGVPPATQGFFRWRRGLSVSAYMYGNKGRNNSDGSFAVPYAPLEQEWGPLYNPWNAQFSINSSAFKNFNVNWSFGLSGAAPYTIRTGFDNNGDLIFNDRPAGVGRNTERGARTVNSYASISYNLGFGRATQVGMPPGIMIMNPGGAPMPVSAMQMPAVPRYRLNFSVFIDNPMNWANYGTYSGVMTSPFFRQPTSVFGVRRITFNTGISF